MSKLIRIAACLLLGVFLCLAFASLLAADEAVGPFHIASHDPPAHEVGVPLNANVQATFDEDVNASTVTNNTFVVHGHLGGLASGTFGYDGGTSTVTLDPDRAFHAGEVLRVSATSGISSTSGVPLTPYGWQFTAGEVYSRGVGRFADVGAGLIGVVYGSAAWGDYDDDGDLDILLTGLSGAYPEDHIRVSRVYRNDGTSGFADIAAGLSAVSESSAAWGDYDNDGDLDILLTGAHVSKVYRNDGSAGFTDIQADLTRVSHSSVAWGDYDNDGDLDILLTGSTGGYNPKSKVYRNDGGGVFTDIGAGLVGVAGSSVAWGDHDNDGDLDILLAGGSTGGLVCKVYRNDGGGAFTDIGAGLPGVGSGSVAWGDYDNDGDLDILLAGCGASMVYRNDGGGAFTDISAGLPRLCASSVAWGDYDNDGDLDILLTGRVAHLVFVSRVYRNDGGGAFADSRASLLPVSWGSVAWGDYDDDGDLDILLTGNADALKLTPVTKVYRNHDNSAPELGDVTPSSGSGPAGDITYFTTSWSDPDGWEDLKHGYFHIGASSSLAGNVTLMYNATKNKLWMRSDDGTTWLGGYAPWSDNTIENRQAKVYCALTRDEGSGDTLSVRWAMKFKADFRGVKKTGLKCSDLYNARAKGAWMGTWNIY
jgi:hypothetical protein